MPNLKEISFRKNLIKKLNFSFSFKFVLTNLETLNFKCNRIDFIDSFSFFSKFPNLQWLDLSFNNFFSLTNSYFRNLKQLKYLFLGKNQILTIQNETFTELKSLTHLDLSNNLLYDLNLIFLELSNLKELLLSSNKIEEITHDSFQGLVNLTLLELSQNKLEFFSNETFFHLKKLKSLSLSYTNINYSFISESFNSLKEIEYLDLSSSYLRQLNILDNLSNIIHLKF